MRLFIATDLPGAVLDQIEAANLRIRTGFRNVRWVRTSGLHLTLKFLGEVPDSRFGEIDNALGTIEAFRFGIRVAGVGFFPNASRPRIFWAGVESEGLRALAAVVDLKMTELGFGSEPRTYTPHLTLARCRGTGRIEGNAVELAKEFHDHAFGRFDAEAFYLYESRLEATGARYTKRSAYTLSNQ